MTSERRFHKNKQTTAKMTDVLVEALSNANSVLVLSRDANADGLLSWVTASSNDAASISVAADFAGIQLASLDVVIGTPQFGKCDSLFVDIIQCLKPGAPIFVLDKVLFSLCTFSMVLWAVPKFD